ncbi:MAG: hypothetical protein JO128_16070, partial [Alphaproteobacteria bacterium]|nr:hypothetical protein [Alphaproteobacteria bacterium]
MTAPSSRFIATARRVAGLGLAVVFLMLLVSPRIGRAADFEVRSPIIDPDEFEYDFKLARGFDRRPASSRGASLVSEFEYGVTTWWSPAIEGEWERPPGPDQPTRFNAVTFENRFQLTPHGRYPLDVGLFVEYERGATNRSPDALRVGPLLRKDIGPTVNILNVEAVTEHGPSSRRDLTALYAWQTQWRVTRAFSPGFEFYGGPTETGRGTPVQQRGGPVFFGVLPFSGDQDVRYEIGYLFGLNRSTPDGTF